MLLTICSPFQAAQITQLSGLVSGQQYYFKNAASTTYLSISHDQSFKGHRAIVGLKNKALDSQKVGGASRVLTISFLIWWLTDACISVDREHHGR
jgi:hypothetical protein